MCVYAHVGYVCVFAIARMNVFLAADDMRERVEPLDILPFLDLVFLSVYAFDVCVCVCAFTCARWHARLSTAQSNRIWIVCIRDEHRYDSRPAVAEMQACHRFKHPHE